MGRTIVRFLVRQFYFRLPGCYQVSCQDLTMFWVYRANAVQACPFESPAVWYGNETE